MKKAPWMPIAAAGLCAGAVTGLLGAGGGMILVPLLTKWGSLEEQEIFPASVSVILPVCLVSIIYRGCCAPLPFREALPYLAGSGLGGIVAGIWGNRIPAKWLHRALGVLLLWGGIRYLC